MEQYRLLAECLLPARMHWPLVLSIQTNEYLCLIHTLLLVTQKKIENK